MKTLLKYYSLLLLLFKLPFFILAQSFTNNDGFTITEIIIKDSLPAKELINRAIAWAQKKHPKYEKENAVGGTAKIELDAKFKIKPKELNPPHDYTGVISMHVKIEVKDGKYRYTINKVHHTADNGKNSGGDITKDIPECGTMLLPDMTWKKIKGEAIRQANVLAEDLKDAMSIPVKTTSEDW